jgi:hypothetical protein
LLRWHAGDAMDVIPDPSALLPLRALQALCLPAGLHCQMERWGAYDVLDRLPQCDVYVETSPA